MSDESISAPPGPRACQAAAWLDIAADEKAESVMRLSPPDVGSIIDIGCGTGAVLAALDRRGFGDTYWACEPSNELATCIPSLAKLAEVEVAPFDEAFHGRSFDLAILSHVVEHVRAPGALIAQALDRARYVLVEVPIEATFVTRTRTRGRDRSVNNRSGHVHFFSESDARKLISVAGGEILGERAYFPFAPYRHLARGAPQKLVLALAGRFERLARYHYEHFAILATARTFKEWDHLYPKP
jgi:SAM-dependent methyltransferase